MSDQSTDGIDREDIQAENVSDLGVEDLIRLFSIRLATYHKRHDMSRSRCIGEIAKEFRDDYTVNILRILDEYGYAHPDGYAWNIEPFGEETMRKYDPVYPESREEGGTADIRAGDLLRIGEDGLLIVGVGDSKFVGMNKSGKIGVHSLATLRNLFASSKYDASLIRNGEAIRGAGAVDDCNVGPDDDWEDVQ